MTVSTATAVEPIVNLKFIIAAAHTVRPSGAVPATAAVFPVFGTRVP